MTRSRRRLVQSLLRSSEPGIRWRTRVRVLGESPDSPTARRLSEEVRRSSVASALLTLRRARHRPNAFGGVYRYYQGSHWTLGALADIGYPAGDPELEPMLDRALAMWTQPQYDQTVEPPEGARAYERAGVTRTRGRYRRCASQQGYALLYGSVLGPADARLDQIVSWLRRWQWPDGGWNCDRTPSADTSSFMETLLPVRGLAAYGERTGSASAKRMARAAAEVFLTRHLYRRRSNGRVIRSAYLQLHFPLYWHHDVLGGLKAMAELGLVRDPRCADALNWLEARELPDGGWPADARFGHYAAVSEPGADFARWGEPNSGRPNPWVTTDALFVLSRAGRLGG